MIVAIQHERVPTSHKDSRDTDEILLPGIAIVFGASLDRSGCSKYLVSVDDAVDLPRSSHTDPSCCVGKNQLVTRTSGICYYDSRYAGHVEYTNGFIRDSFSHDWHSKIKNYDLKYFF